MSRKPQLRCEPEIPATWTDEQIVDLIAWLELRAQQLRRGARQTGKAVKIHDAEWTRNNVTYYRHAAGAMRWLKHHLETDLVRRANQRKVANGGASRRAKSWQ